MNDYSFPGSVRLRGGLIALCKIRERTRGLEPAYRFRCSSAIKTMARDATCFIDLLTRVEVQCGVIFGLCKQDGRRHAQSQKHEGNQSSNVSGYSSVFLFSYSDSGIYHRD